MLAVEELLLDRRREAGLLWLLERGEAGWLGLLLLEIRVEAGRLRHDAVLELVKSSVWLAEFGELWLHWLGKVLLQPLLA